MNVERHADAARFLHEAGPLLLADEARHNLVLGLAGTIRDAPGLYDSKTFWIVRDGADVAAAALRTPPYNLVLARPRSDEALTALAGAVDDDLPGVVGGVPEVHEFAARWSGARAASVRRMLDQGVYALERVNPIEPPAGGAREAEPSELGLLLEWYAAFVAETLPQEEAGAGRHRRQIESRLASEDAGIALWEVDGEPVSMAGYGGRTPNGIRIGPVYTPPRLRGRGYGTALVADLSGRLLAGGRQFCFLFTDLANPTSNAIYERIGYERVCESAQLAFERLDR